MYNNRNQNHRIVNQRIRSRHIHLSKSQILSSWIWGIVFALILIAGAIAVVHENRELQREQLLSAKCVDENDSINTRLIDLMVEGKFAGVRYEVIGNQSHLYVDNEVLEKAGTNYSSLLTWYLWNDQSTTNNVTDWQYQFGIWKSPCSQK